MKKSKMTEAQKTIVAERLAMGKKRKLQEEINKATADKQDIIDQQNAELDELRASISEKNVENTSTFIRTGSPDDKLQAELDEMKKELADLKLVLSNSGGLPKKISTTPWSSVGKPFHKDIFKTKTKHNGYELTFISESEVDDYTASGYTVARGQDYGMKEGALKAKRMIGVERPIAAANEAREIKRAFNQAQRLSALQKTKEMSENIRQASGGRTELEANL